MAPVPGGWLPARCKPGDLPVCPLGPRTRPVCSRRGSPGPILVEGLREGLVLSSQSTPDPATLTLQVSHGRVRTTILRLVCWSLAGGGRGEMAYRMMNLEEIEEGAGKASCFYKSLWEILALWSTAKREHKDGIHWLPSLKRKNPRRPWMCIRCLCLKSTVYGKQINLLHRMSWCFSNSCFRAVPRGR